MRYVASKEGAVRAARIQLIVQLARTSHGKWYRGLQGSSLGTRSVERSGVMNMPP